MDNSLKNIEISPIYAKEIARRKRRFLPVQQIGFLAKKREVLKQEFQTLNFSFILDGGGYVTVDGQRVEVNAPAVFVQWPGVFQDYGPTEPYSFWKEIYFIYDAVLVSDFTNSLLVHPDRLYWEIGDQSKVCDLLIEINRLIKRGQITEDIEQLDLLCEWLIMESQPHEFTPADPVLQQLLRVKNEIDSHFRILKNIDEVALKVGLSRSTFRLHWPKISQLSPHRYLNKQKLQLACRLLIETNLPIGQIAESSGFEDRFYFSRKFREAYELTPKQYRKRNRF